jgi:hypothetical protein
LPNTRIMESGAKGCHWLPVAGATSRFRGHRHRHAVTHSKRTKGKSSLGEFQDDVDLCGDE